jgi:murein peptide amidase A
MQRLGKNSGGYLGEPIDVHAVLGEIKTAAQEHGWTQETFHSNDDFKWFALRRLSRSTLNCKPSARFYISTGIHGDEPAGPLAALRLMRDNLWPDSAEIVLLPCLNPVGFANGRRENAQGIDLNRDYLTPQSPEIRAHIAWLEKQAAFDLCLCLHEDWESHGFYLYELNPDGKPSLAERMIAAAAQVCPIDLSPIIEGREAHGGIIRPSVDPRTRPLWPESFWLLRNKTRLSYTLEAPSDFELRVRVNALVAATQAAMVVPLPPLI